MYGNTEINGELQKTVSRVYLDHPAPLTEVLARVLHVNPPLCTVYLGQNAVCAVPQIPLLSRQLIIRTCTVFFVAQRRLI